MKRTNQWILTLFVIGFIFSACAPSNDNGQPEDTSMDEITLTIEELAMYDGTNGNPAYVAVDGMIYDVSDSDFWKEGAHNGFQAGRDLTDAIKNESPHGVKNLERIPKVGRIVTE